MLFPESPISTFHFHRADYDIECSYPKNNNGSTSQYRRYLSVYNQSKNVKL